MQIFPEWFIIIGIPIVLIIVTTTSRLFAKRLTMEDSGVDLHITGFTFIVATVGSEHPIQPIDELLSPLKGPVLFIVAIFIAITVGLYGRAYESKKFQSLCFCSGLAFFVFGLWWALEFIGLSLINWIIINELVNAVIFLGIGGLFMLIALLIRFLTWKPAQK